MLCHNCEKEPATVHLTRTHPVRSEIDLCPSCAGLVCDICKQPATYHLTHTDQKGQRRIDLCGSCAKQHGVDDPRNTSLARLVEQYGKKLPSGG
jgi:protein-arginine kinase activator protein McsA